MKRVGYKPEVAASIEAGASMGGQIMPPIMGASAFVMADLLGISYSKVVIMAAIPAILYFSSVATFVHLHALKSGVMHVNEKVDIRRLLATGPLFIIPLFAILVTLFRGYPAMIAAFWGIASLLLVAFIRKGTRPSLGEIAAGCVRGAVVGSRIAVAAATLGTIISLMTKTGLGLKIGFSVEMWSGGNIFLALMILMAAIIILGLEMPTVASYLIAAIVAIPGLVRLGLNPSQAHMFAFFFASSAGLTPPVGMAAVVASKLADAPYIKTALNAVNAAAAAYLLPFVFVFNGALLLLPDTKSLSLVISIIMVLLGLVTFQMGFVGYFSRRLDLWERLLMIVSGLGFLLFAALGIYLALIVSAILLFLMILRQLTGKKQVV
jgi:TRAP transporter 4TM/12TM fusion protein